MRIPLLLAFAAAIAIGTLSQPALADTFSACGDSYHWDSYERGIRSAFSKNADLRPSLNDEGCYQAGLRQGPLAIAAGDLGCDDDFSTGHADGLIQAQRHSGGNCYDLGYDAGRADLDIGAREADVHLVGDACVRAYRKGRADYIGGTSSESTDFNAPRALYCYNLGLYESPFFLQ
jgi:hypothetical protein